MSYSWAATWQNQQNECAPSEDSDQPGDPPSLIRVFAGRMKKAWVLTYPLSAQRRLWSDWADAQAHLSLHWAHTHFVGFVMSRLIFHAHLHIFNIVASKVHVFNCLLTFLQRWINNWAASWQNQQNGMHVQQRLRSTWASPQSDQSLRCPHEESLDP